jgi:hypothetical protein
MGAMVALTALLVWPGSAWLARAATNRVVATSGSDTGNDCSNSATPCATIQHAIEQATAGDTIQVAAGTYQEHVTVNKDVTIRGAGASSTIVDGTDSGRVFQINSGVTVTLDKLKITRGRVNTAGPPFYNNLGGGISNLGTLTLTNSTVSNNISADGGSGIVNYASLTIINSTISDNTLDSGCRDCFHLGGGIFSFDYGSLSISNSTISNNQAVIGGGIWGGGSMTISHSTLSNNHAYGEGGAIFFIPDTLFVINSTLSGNISETGAGAIDTDRGSNVLVVNSTLSNHQGGTVISNRQLAKLINCTLSNNFTQFVLGNGGYSIPVTGAVLEVSNSTILQSVPNTLVIRNYAANTVRIKNSIVSGSSLGCFNEGTFTASGTNFDTDGSCSGFTHVTSDDLNLGPLQNNGGPTETHALGPGSVAIDAVTDCTDLGGSTLTQDQRGVLRPQPMGADCDAGAYEAQQSKLTVNKTGSGSGTVTSAPTGINCGADCSEYYLADSNLMLTATADPGSVFIGWSGQCSGTNPTTTVTMGLSNKSCTARFALSGTIIINKVALSGDATFNFTASNGLSNFAITTSGGDGSRTFSNISAGTKTVTETLPSGWTLTGLVCTDPDNGTTVNLSARRATIDLDAGETITCTFTNTKSSGNGGNGSLYTLQGAGSVCLTMNLQTQQYMFKDGRRTIAGIFTYRQTGQTIRFQSAYGDQNRLSGSINLSTRTASATLTLPFSLGGQRFTFNTLATAPCA